MPTFQSNKGDLLWDATAIPNAFLCEYMPAAPEGHVKAYLYGYMYAHHVSSDSALLLSDVAKALSMEESDVQAAFRYWERCRLVQRLQDHPPKYCFLGVQQTLMSRQTAPQDEGYMAFAQALYAIFGDRRKLHGNETVLAYEWVEQMGLPGEVVLMMIQHLVSTRGVQFSFKEAQKLALELCEQHIKSLEAAEQLFSRSESAWKGTRKVLRRMGKYRDPSLDETDLYIKWTTEWGFAVKAIESACAEMTGGDPSFKYLDKILQAIRERSGLTTISATQLEKQLSREKEEAELIREMLAACGVKAAVIDEGKRLIYRDMLQYGDHALIMLAAEIIGRRGGHSLDGITGLLRSWQALELSTPAEVQAYSEALRSQNQLLRKLYQLIGLDRKPTPDDRELLSKWQQEWHFEESLLRHAATQAKNARSPMAFINTVLQAWHEKGITTIEEAESDRESFRATAAQAAAAKQSPGIPAKGGKTVIEQQYKQRTYDPEKYTGFTAEELEEINKS